ncbi:MAG: hypothetical protein R3325_12060 [Thermoanaerobaculia bacterium]|nr:hypothetical protein [Thermoanaerobaculia bacterium]
MNRETEPLQIQFDPPAEIFATDSGGRFRFPLVVKGAQRIDTRRYDEARFVVSIWYASGGLSIDLDRAYVELCCAIDPEDDHWIKLAEIEPVVPPYNSDVSFDGWIVLPVLSGSSAFALNGSGFESRARLQVRASAYLVS